VGYSVGMSPSRRKTACGILWWKRTCAWIETGITEGSHEQWFDEYPFGEYPTRQFKCTTCGKVEWR